MRKTPVLFVVLSLFALMSTPASAAELPGGKANFVVSLGSFTLGKTNWMRLGDYTFSADSKVRARTYLWQQSKPVARQGTGTTPDLSCSTHATAVSQTLVRACPVLTVGGFTGAPTEERAGNYRIDDGRLHITWNVPGWHEQWAIVASPDNKLVRLDFVSNALATAGYAYGSNAPLTTRRQMASVQAFPGTLVQDYRGWDHLKLTTSPDEGDVFQIDKYRTCTTTSWCLTYLNRYPVKACKDGAGCPGTGGGSAIDDSSLQSYIVRVSNNDRRDTYWHWCTCLTRKPDGRDIEKCYSKNSHVKPMLQILDDDGQFHGWVGVEASFNPAPTPTGDLRDADMLSAFRVSDFR